MLSAVRRLLPLLLAALPSLAGPVPLWSAKIGGYADKPSFADLDGSGRLQVVLSTDQGVVCALGGSNGAVLWSRTFDDETFLSGPIVADVDGDGGAEVLVTGSRRGTIACLNGNDGSDRWFIKPRGDSIPGVPALITVGTTGKQALVLVQDTDLRALDAATGEELWKATLPSNSSGSVGVGELDGKSVVLVGTNRNKVCCFDTTGQPVWETEVKGRISVAPIVVDADGDGQPEIYVIGNYLERLDSRGVSQWRWCPPANAGIASGLALGDLDGNGRKTLVLTAYEGGLFAITPKGSVKWRATVVSIDPNAVSNFTPGSTPALVATTGRAGADVLLASPIPSAGGVFAFDGRTGERLWRSPLPAFSLCCPGVADINGSGTADVVAADSRGNVTAFDLGTRPATGWLRYGGSLFNTASETVVAAHATALLAGKAAFPVKPRTVPWADLVSGQSSSPTTTPPTVPTTPRPSSAIAIQLNGRWLDLDPAAVRIEGRTMVPLRGLFEALKAQVAWEAPTKTITATRGATTVVLRVGSKMASVNGETVVLDVPSQLVDSKTYVPLRFVAQALGCKVEWVEATQDVLVTSAP